MAAVQLDPDQPVDRRRARSSSSPTRSPPTSSCATSSSSTPSRGCRRARCSAARSATSGRPPLASGERALMDVRLSPEQQALRDSAAQVVDRLGPHAVGQLDDAERAGQARRRRRRRRLARAAHRRPTTARRWASAVEVAIVAEELGRGLADAAFLGPTLAAELRRLAGAPAGHRGRDGRAHRRPRRRWPRSPTATLPAGAVAIDARGADAGARARGRRRRPRARPRSPLDRRGRATSTSPGRRSPGSVGDGRRRRPTRPGRSTADDLARVDRARPGHSPAPTSSAPCAARSTSPPTTPPSAASTARPIGSFQAVQHLLADAFVATEGSRSVALHAAWAVDALAAGRRAGRRARWPRPTAPGPPAPCARPPSRCTAASATPGSAWPTSTCAGRCCRATSSAASGASLARVLAHHGIGGDRWTSVTRPTRPRSAPRLRAWLRDNNPGLPASSTVDDYWAGQAALAPVALRRRLLRPVVADGDRRPGAARASTT